MFRPAPTPFSGRDSAVRLRALQGLLSASPAPAGQAELAPEDAECLLLVGGEDGRNNIGSMAALKFLFLGASGVELLDGTIDEEHAELDDLLLLVQRTSVAIAYADSARELVLPIISEWRHCTELRVLHKEQLDSEVGELQKIKNFLEMVDLPAAVFGVPLPLHFDNEIEALESWPIVQAYALDEVGGGGFFTMRKRIVDVRATLQALFRDVDHVATRKALEEAVPLLEHQWRTFVADFDQVESPATRAGFSEEQLGDTLLSSYAFGLLRRTAKGFVAPPGRGARVLLGCHTNDWHGASDDRIIRTAGVAGRAALHFTAEAEDPHSGLRVCRTYFLTCAHVAPTIVDADALTRAGSDDEADDGLERKAGEEGGGEKEGEEEEYDARDARCLFDTYQVLVAALRAAVAEVCRLQRSSVASITDAVRDVAVGVLTEGGVEDADGDLEVLVDVVDACGESVETLSSRRSYLTFVRLSLCNVFSVQVPGEVLGALAVGDTVVSEAVVTGQIPYFRSWMAEGREEGSMVKQRRMLLDAHMTRGPLLQLGEFQPPVVPDALLLLGGSELAPTVKGSVRLHSEGLVFLSPSFTQLVLSIELDVEEMGIASSASASEREEVGDVLWMRVRQAKLDATLPLPAAPYVGFLLGEDDAMRARVSQTLALWHRAAKAVDVPFDSRAANELPAALRPAFDSLVAATRPARRSHVQAVVRAAAAHAARGPPPLADHHDDDAVPVTVLFGVPGSQVQQVAANLISFSSSDNDWRLVQVANSGLETDPEALRRELRGALDASGVGGGKLRRICLVVCGYDDPAVVVPVVMREPRCYVACVATCVSLRCLYSDERHTRFFPRLLSQCSREWCNAVLLADGSQEPAEDQLMRQRLKGATVLRLDRTGLSGVDVETLTSLSGFADDTLSADRVADDVPPLPATVQRVELELRCVVDRDRLVAWACALLPHTRITTVVKPTPNAGIKRAQALARERVLAKLGRGSETKGEEGAEETKAEQKEDAEPEDLAAEAAAATAGVGRCWTLSAQVRCSDGQEYEFDGGRLRGVADVLAPGAPCRFAVTGEGLDAERLRAALMQCRPKSGLVHRELRTRASVTKAELDRINQAAVDAMGADGPPPGYTFDGRTFIDFTGMRFARHPQLEELVAEFLEAQNAEIERVNREVALEDKSL